MEVAGFYRGTRGTFHKKLYIYIYHGHRRRKITSHMISQKVKFPHPRHESVWGAKVYLLLLLLLVLVVIVAVTSQLDGVCA